MHNIISTVARQNPTDWPLDKRRASSGRHPLFIRAQYGQIAWAQRHCATNGDGNAQGTRPCRFHSPEPEHT